jgi:cyclic pyranopterin phosphate synthase
VALAHENAGEIEALMQFAAAGGHDLTLIETMPLGEIGEDRLDQYLPLSRVRRDLAQRYTLTDLPHRTGGPARYVRVEELGLQLGFITPLTHNFCESCNRVRLTATGQLFMCLGQDDQADLKAVIRRVGSDEAAIDAALDEAISRKPKGHDFVIERRGARPAVARHMSLTGG